MRKTLATAALLPAALIAGTALAQGNGFYVGASGGYTNGDVDDSRIKSQADGPGITNITVSKDSSDIGFKLFGGYMFNELFSVEGGYFNLGKSGYRASRFSGTPQNPISEGTLDGEVATSGLNVDVLAGMVNNPGFNFWGRAGLILVRAEGDYSGSGYTPSSSGNDETEFSFKFGFGLGYTYRTNWSVRLDYEYYRVPDTLGGDFGIEAITLGAIYRF
jgi:OOP family OmpA-OmpF porin